MSAPVEDPEALARRVRDLRRLAGRVDPERFACTVDDVSDPGSVGVRWRRGSWNLKGMGSPYRIGKAGVPAIRAKKPCRLENEW